MKKNKKKIIPAVISMIMLVLLIVLVTQALENQEKAKLEKLAETETEDYFSDYLDVHYLELGGEIYTYSDRIENYLFIGTDHSGQEDATGDEYQGSMADFLAVLMTNSTKEEYAVIQLNRDTMTEIVLMDHNGEDTGSEFMQLCTAHWYGGDKEQSCENTVDAVSNLLGELDIDGYYAMPMDRIADLNHSVGGVTLTVQGDFSRVDAGLKEGETVTLTDEQAETYIRGRMNVGDGENVSRMSRQLQYLQAFSSQAKAKLKEDPGFAMDTIEELEPYTTTDINNNTISKLLNRLSKFDSLGILQLEGETSIGQALGDDIDHTEFRLDQSALRELLTELYGLEIM